METANILREDPSLGPALEPFARVFVRCTYTLDVISSCRLCNRGNLGAPQIQHETQRGCKDAPNQIHETNNAVVRFSMQRIAWHK